MVSKTLAVTLILLELNVSVLDVTLFPSESYAAGTNLFAKSSDTLFTLRYTLTESICLMADSPPDTSIIFGFAIHSPMLYPFSGFPSVITVTLTCLLALFSRETFKTWSHSRVTSDETFIVNDGLIATAFTAERSDKSAVALMSDASSLSTTLFFPRTFTLAVLPSMTS